MTTTSCVGGGELKLLRISTAFAGIYSTIYPRRPLSPTDLAYIGDRAAAIRRDWRPTHEAEQFFALLDRVGVPGSLSDQQYDDMVLMCKNLADDLLGQYRAVARAQDYDD